MEERVSLAQDVLAPEPRDEGAESGAAEVLVAVVRACIDDAMRRAAPVDDPHSSSAFSVTGSNSRLTSAMES